MQASLRTQWGSIAAHKYIPLKEAYAQRRGMDGACYDKGIPFFGEKGF